MTMPLLEQETADIGHLDFEAALACEIPAGCGRAAAWISRCRRCGRGPAVCHEHRAKIIEDFERYTATTRIACPKCREMVPASAWRDLVEFIPLGGT